MNEGNHKEHKEHIAKKRASSLFLAVLLCDLCGSPGSALISGPSPTPHAPSPFAVRPKPSSEWEQRSRGVMCSRDRNDERVHRERGEPADHARSQRLSALQRERAECDVDDEQ